ncbi:MAG: PfkB family carbohydrate kinase [Kiritimatiellia bacterium]
MADLGMIVVGSVGLDTIETRDAKRVEVLGGSVSYACAAASFFTKTGMVGVVGTDFPEEAMKQYRAYGIDLAGLETAEGKTFRWGGVYAEDMINRTTRFTELNVFADFHPRLPESYCDVPFVMLGNISPELQLEVLEQTKGARFVVADTMDLWINIADQALLDVISKVDMLLLNDAEARLLTGEHHVLQCARWILDRGPRYVVIKKGEHGAMLVTKEDIAIIPAYPVDAVVDPTGAGDCFAGGFLGYLASRGSVDDRTVRQALLYGSVIASFGVEAFSLERLAGLSPADIEERAASLREMIRFT